jgi:hypothetical protein
MTLLSDTVTQVGHLVRSSNYNGNSDSGPIPQFETLVYGSGVMKSPGFKSRKGVARAAPGPTYWKEWFRMNYGEQHYSHVESNGVTTLYDFLDGPGQSVTANDYESPLVLADASYKAKVKLFNEMKGEGANLANMLGERHQVVKSVENVLNILIHSVRDLRHGRIASAIRRFGGDPLTARKLRKKDIADQWLSLQYGWKPLLSDVYDVINGAHLREKTAPHTFRASASASHGLDVRNLDAWLNDSWYHQPAGWYKTEAIQKFTIRAFPNIALAEPAALGFTNPLEVLWEVTPWSFVVDWFLPVGRYLDQLTADHGWIFYDGSVSGLRKISAVANWSKAEGHSSGGWNYSTSQSFFGGYDHVIFERNVLFGFPSPDVPKFKNPLTITHYLNSVALLAQLMGRK